MRGAARWLEQPDETSAEAAVRAFAGKAGTYPRLDDEVGDRFPINGADHFMLTVPVEVADGFDADGKIGEQLLPQAEAIAPGGGLSIRQHTDHVGDEESGWSQVGFHDEAADEQAVVMVVDSVVFVSRFLKFRLFMVSGFPIVPVCLRLLFVMGWVRSFRKLIGGGDSEADREFQVRRSEVEVESRSDGAVFPASAGLIHKIRLKAERGAGQEAKQNAGGITESIILPFVLVGEGAQGQSVAGGGDAGVVQQEKILTVMGGGRSGEGEKQ